jgi:hypothetical protein
MLFLSIPGLAVLALSASALMTRQYVTRQYLAKRFGVTDRTISNMISRGDLTGYRLPGVRAIRVDLNEAEALVKAVPTAFKPKVPFGPKAHIVQVEAQADGQDQAEAATGEDR